METGKRRLASSRLDDRDAPPVPRRLDDGADDATKTSRPPTDKELTRALLLAGDVEPGTGFHTTAEELKKLAAERYAAREAELDAVEAKYRAQTPEVVPPGGLDLDPSRSFWEHATTRHVCGDDNRADQYWLYRPENRDVLAELREALGEAPPPDEAAAAAALAVVAGDRRSPAMRDSPRASPRPPASPADSLASPVGRPSPSPTGSDGGFPRDDDDDETKGESKGDESISGRY